MTEAPICHGDGLAFAAAEFTRLADAWPGRPVTLGLAGAAPVAERLARLGLEVAPGSESYAIVADAEGLLLAGGRPRAVLYAVYDCAETWLGWCFAAPGQDLRVTAPLPLPATLARRHAPAFAIRGLGFHGVSDIPSLLDFMAKRRLNRPQFVIQHWIAERDTFAPLVAERDFDLDLGVHCLNHFLPEQTYHAEHPEWYASVDSRFGRQLRFANLDSVPELVRNAARFLAAEPMVRWLGLWPLDGTVFEPEEIASGDFGGLLLRYVNAIAERLAPDFPHLRFDHLAYVGYAAPPAQGRPHPAVTVSCCHYWDQQRLPPIYDAWFGRERLANDADRATARTRFHPLRTHAECCAHLLGWLDRGPAIVFTYFTDANLAQTSVCDLPPTMQQELRYYHAIGAAGVLDCCCAGSHHALFLREFHALGRLLWDPDTADPADDARVLPALVGAAAPHLAAAYAALRLAWETPVHAGYRPGDLLTRGMRVYAMLRWHPRTHESSLRQLEALFAVPLAHLDAARQAQPAPLLTLLATNVRRQLHLLRVYHFLLAWRTTGDAAWLDAADRQLAAWAADQPADAAHASLVSFTREQRMTNDE